MAEGFEEFSAAINFCVCQALGEKTEGLVRFLAAAFKTGKQRKFGGSIVSVNLEEKIKKENEQLEKSESLLEKTVKKAMNFGRKSKNTQKKETASDGKQQSEEIKEASAQGKGTAKEPAKKRQPAGRAGSKKTAQQGQKGKEPAPSSKQSAPAKAPAKSRQAGEKRVQGFGQDRIWDPRQKVGGKRGEKAGGTDHLFRRLGRNRQECHRL